MDTLAIGRLCAGFGFCVKWAVEKFCQAKAAGCWGSSHSGPVAGQALLWMSSHTADPQPMSETEGAPVPFAAALHCSILGEPPSCSLRNAETNYLLFTQSIYWRVHLELRDNKLISDTTYVKLKCHLFVSCYSFWDFPWIVFPFSGLWCLRVTFGCLSASPHCLGMKPHVLVSSWNVFNQQFPNVLHGLLGSPISSQGYHFSLEMTFCG